MTGFTYIVPDAEAFIHTLRRYLQTIGQGHIVPLLMNSTCDITTSSSFSRIRWDAYATTITFYVALENIPKFTNDVKKDLFPAIDVVFPKNAGYDITEIVIAPFLESPSDDEKIPLAIFPTSNGIIEYDSLKFRSQSEIRVYDVLKKRNVLFFANAMVDSTAITRFSKTANNYLPL